MLMLGSSLMQEDYKYSMLFSFLYLTFGVESLSYLKEYSRLWIENAKIFYGEVVQITEKGTYGCLGQGVPPKEIRRTKC